MRTRGDLPDTEVAEVPVDSPVLWRGAVLDYYDGVSWRAPSDSTYGTPLAGGPHFDLPTTDSNARHGRRAARRRTSACRVHRSAARTRPADLRRRGRSGAAPVRGVLRLGGIRAGVSGGLHGHLAGDRSAPFAAGADAGRHGAVRACRATPCSCPSTVPERVRALAKRITRWAPDRDAATRAVESYLRDERDLSARLARSAARCAMPLTTSCSWRTPASASSSRPLRWCCCGQQACRRAWQPASPVASPRATTARCVVPTRTRGSRSGIRTSGGQRPTRRPAPAAPTSGLPTGSRPGCRTPRGGSSSRPAVLAAVALVALSLWWWRRRDPPGSCPTG